MNNDDIILTKPEMNYKKDINENLTGDNNNLYDRFVKMNEANDSIIFKIKNKKEEMYNKNVIRNKQINDIKQAEITIKNKVKEIDKTNLNIEKYKKNNKDKEMHSNNLFKTLEDIKQENLDLKAHCHCRKNEINNDKTHCSKNDKIN